MNSCTFSGRLTRDVELRSIGEKDTKLGVFSLAVNNSSKNKDTDKYDASFFDFEVWGKFAEIIEKHFKKGDPIEVVCEAKQDTWDDKDSGKKRSKVKFRVINFCFPQTGIKKNSADAQEKNNEAAPPTNGDDIPF